MSKLYFRHKRVLALLVTIIFLLSSNAQGIAVMAEVLEDSERQQTEDISTERSIEWESDDPNSMTGEQDSTTEEQADITQEEEGTSEEEGTTQEQDASTVEPEEPELPEEDPTVLAFPVNTSAQFVNAISNGESEIEISGNSNHEFYVNTADFGANAGNGIVVPNNANIKITGTDNEPVKIILAGTVTSNQRLFRIEAGRTVTLELDNVIIDGNGRSTGIHVLDGARFTLQGFNNAAINNSIRPEGNGGAISLFRNAVLTVRDMSFEGNQVGSNGNEYAGGAIFASARNGANIAAGDKVTVNLAGCTFKNNASVYGDFTSTSALEGWGNGGAVFIYSGDLRVAGCTFEDNSAGMHGGAIALQTHVGSITSETEDYEFYRSKFDLDVFEKGYNSDGTWHVEQYRGPSVFRRNTAGACGGAIAGGTKRRRVATGVNTYVENIIRDFWIGNLAYDASKDATKAFNGFNAITSQMTRDQIRSEQYIGQKHIFEENKVTKGLGGAVYYTSFLVSSDWTNRFRAEINSADFVNNKVTDVPLNTVEYGAGAVMMHIQQRGENNGVVVPTIRNCDFMGNSTIGGVGGSILICGSGNLIDCNISGSSASSNGIKKVDDTSARAGGTDSKGGAVVFSIDKKYLNKQFAPNLRDFYTVENCRIEDSWTNGYGGALFVGGEGNPPSVVNISNSTFKDINTYNWTIPQGAATGYASGRGAVFLLSMSILNMDNCVFDNCYATQDGGALVLQGVPQDAQPSGYHQISNTVFRNSSADRNGGGLFMGTTSKARLNNVNFYHNKATGKDRNSGAPSNGTGNGGGIYMNTNTSGNNWATLIMNNSTLVGNEAVQDGGAVCLGRASQTTNMTRVVQLYERLTLNNVKFDENKSIRGYRWNEQLSSLLAQKYKERITQTTKFSKDKNDVVYTNALNNDDVNFLGAPDVETIKYVTKVVSADGSEISIEERANGFAVIKDDGEVEYGTIKAAMNAISVKVGDIVSYKIQFTNKSDFGDGDFSFGLTELFEHDVEFISAKDTTGLLDETGAGTSGDASGLGNNGRTYRWENIVLAGGQTKEVEITVLLGEKAGPILSNSVDVDVDDRPPINIPAEHVKFDELKQLYFVNEQGQLEEWDKDNALEKDNEVIYRIYFNNNLTEDVTYYFDANLGEYVPTPISGAATVVRNESVGPMNITIEDTLPKGVELTNMVGWTGVGGESASWSKVAGQENTYRITIPNVQYDHQIGSGNQMDMPFVQMHVKINQEAVNTALMEANGQQPKILNRAKIIYNKLDGTNVDEGEVEIDNDITGDISAPTKTVETINGESNRAAASVGDVIEYKISYQNLMGVNLTNFSLTDNLPDGVAVDSTSVVVTPSGAVPNPAELISITDDAVTWGGVSTTIPVGALVELTVNLKILDTAQGTILRNKAKVTFDEQDDDDDGESDDVEVPVGSMKIGKRVITETGLFRAAAPTLDNDRHLVVGSQVRYEVIFKNQTGSEASVEITDSLPPGTSFVSFDYNGPGTLDNAVSGWTGSEVRWKINNVPNDGQGTAIVVANVNAMPADGLLKNEAEVRYITDDDSIEEKPGTENQVDEEGTYKEAGIMGENGVWQELNESVKAGDTIVYRIHYRNDSPTTNATVTIAEQPGNGLEFAEFGVGDTTESNITQRPSASNSLTTIIENIGPGQGGYVTYSFRVADSAGASVKNGLTVSYSNQPGNKTDEVEVPVKSRKTVDSYEPKDNTQTDWGTLEVGDTLTYRIPFTNSYTNTRNQAVITDILPEGMRLTETPAASGYTVVMYNGTQTVTDYTQADRVVWTYAPTGGIASGQGGEVTVKMQLVEQPENRTITNQASVNFDGDIDDDDDLKIDHEIDPKPVKKFIGVDDKTGQISASVGDTLNFQISFMNTLDTAMHLVELTDEVSDQFKIIGADGSLDGTPLSGSNLPVIDNNVISWSAQTLAPEAKVVLDIKVQVQETVFASAGEGQAIVLTNKASAKYRPGSETEPEVITDTDEVEVPIGSWKNGERLNIAGRSVYTGEYVVVGEAVQYTLHYRNSSTQRATITVIDNLTPLLSYAEYNNDANVPPTSFNNNVLTWTFPDVEPGAGGSITFSIKINETPPTGKIENKAEVRFEYEDGTITTETPEVENPVEDNGTKKVTGRLDDSGSWEEAGQAVKVGDDLYYRIYFRNDLDETATASITEEPGSGLSFEGYLFDAEHAKLPTGSTAEVDSTNSLKLIISDIPIGGDGYVLAHFKVTDQAGAVVHNKVSVDYEDTGGDDSHEEDETEDPLPSRKTVGSFNGVDADGTSGAPTPDDWEALKRGDTVGYRILFANPHDEVFKSAIIEDHIPEGMELTELVSAGAAYQVAYFDSENNPLDESTLSLDEVRLVQWTYTPAGGVGPGQGDEVKVELKLVEYPEGKQEIINKASVSYERDDGGKEDDGSGDLENPHEINPTLFKDIVDIAGNSTRLSASVGDEINFRIRFKNSYETALRNIKITDQIQSGFTYQSSTVMYGNQSLGQMDNNNGLLIWESEDGFELPADEQITITIRVTVAESGFAEGRISNRAEVEFEDPDDPTGDPAGEPSNEVQVPIGSWKFGQREEELAEVLTPELSPIAAPIVTNLTDVSHLAVDGLVRYTIRYQNNYEDQADITIRDILPPGTQYMSAGGGGIAAHNPDTRTVTWTIDDVNPEASGEVWVVLRITDQVQLTETRTLDNKATVEFDLGDNNVVTEEPESENPVGEKGTYKLGGLLQADDSWEELDRPLKIGDDVYYRIYFRNDSTEHAVNVTISETDFDGLEFVGFMLDSPYSDIPSSNYDNSDPNVVVIEGVPVGEGGYVLVHFTVGDDVKQAAVNTANIKYSYEPPSGNPLEKEEKPTEETPISSRKTVSGFTSKDGVRTVSEILRIGDQVEYDILFANKYKDRRFQSAIVTDSLPEGMELASLITAVPGYQAEYLDADSEVLDPAVMTLQQVRHVRWTYTPGNGMGYGQGGVVSLNLKLTAMPDDYEIHNSAAVEYVPYDGDPGGTDKVPDDSEDLIVPHIVKPAPVKEIVGVDEKAEQISASVGDVITFKVDFKNTTGDIIEDLVITDQIQNGFTILEATAASAGQQVSEPNVTGQQITWSADTFAVDQEVTLMIKVQVEAEEFEAASGRYTLKNQASAAYRNPKNPPGEEDENEPSEEKEIPIGSWKVGERMEPETNPVVPMPTAFMSQTELIDKSFVAKGKQMKFTIHYRNNYDETADIEISDNLTELLKYAEYSGEFGSSIPDLTPEYSDENKTLTWKIPGVVPGEQGHVWFIMDITSLPEIEAGEEFAKLKNSAKVDYQLPNGDTVTETPGSENPVAEEASRKIAMRHTTFGGEDVYTPYDVPISIGDQIFYFVYYRNDSLDKDATVQIREFPGTGLEYKEFREGEPPVGATVTPPASSSMEAKIEDVGPGQGGYVIYVFEVTDQVSATAINKATVTYQYDDGEGGTTDRDEEIESEDPILSRKTVGEFNGAAVNSDGDPLTEKDWNILHIGDKVRYRIIFANPHDKTYTHATITEHIPEGMVLRSYDSTTASVSTLDGEGESTDELEDTRMLVWNYKTDEGIAPGKGAEFWVELELVELSQSGRIKNEVDVDYVRIIEDEDPEVDPDESDELEVIHRTNPTPEKTMISVNGDTTRKTVSVGDIVEFKIEFENVYDDKILEDVIVTDTIDDKFELLDGTIQLYEKDAVNPIQTLDVKDYYNDRQVVWGQDGNTMQAGEKIIITLNLRVNDKVFEAGSSDEAHRKTAMNQARVTYTIDGEDKDEPSDEVEVPIGSMKTAKRYEMPWSADFGRTVTPRLSAADLLPPLNMISDEYLILDGHVYFKINYHNNDKKASKVTIKDEYPQWTQYHSAGGEGAATEHEESLRKVTWTIDNVEPGTGGFAWLILKISDDPDAAEDTLKNKAVITFEPEGETPYTEEPTSENPVTGIGTKKAAGTMEEQDDGSQVWVQLEGGLREGKEVYYRIYFRNERLEGNVTAAISEPTDQTGLEFISFLPDESELPEGGQIDPDYEEGSTEIVITGIEPGLGGYVIAAFTITSEAEQAVVNQARVVYSVEGQTTPETKVEIPMTVDPVQSRKTVSLYNGNQDVTEEDWGTLEVGDQIRYRIVFSNLIDAEQTHNKAVITDTIPDGLTLVEAQTGSDLTVAYLNEFGEEFAQLPTDLEAVRFVRWTYEPAEGIAYGAGGEVWIDLKLTESPDADKVINEADVTYHREDESGSEITDDDGSDDMTVEHEVDNWSTKDLVVIGTPFEDDPGSAVLTVGKPHSYTIGYHNKLETAAKVTITDTLPGELIFQGASGDYELFDDLDNTITQPIEEADKERVRKVVWSFESVPIDGDGEVSLDVLLSENINGFTVENVAQVDYVGEDGDEHTDKPIEETPVQPAKLLVSTASDPDKEIDPEGDVNDVLSNFSRMNGYYKPVHAKEEVMYVVAFANTSMQPITNVKITDYLDSENGGLSFRQAYLAQKQDDGNDGFIWVPEVFDDYEVISAGEVVFNLGTMAPGEELRLYIWASVNERAVNKITNEIEINYDQIDEDDPSSVITENPVWSYKRIAPDSGESDTQINIGDVIPYEIFYTNNTGEKMKKVVIRDIIPEGMELVNYEPEADAGIEVILYDEDETETDNIREARVIQWTIEPEDGIENMQGGKVSIETEAVQAPREGLYINRSEVGFEDENGTKVPDDSEDLTTENPAGTMKFVSSEGDGFDMSALLVGDEVKYVIQYVNPDPDDLRTVTITENIPDGMEVVDYAHKGDTDYIKSADDEQVIWEFDVKAGKYGQVWITLRVTEQAINESDGTIKNDAVVEWDDGSDDTTVTTETENPVNKKLIKSGTGADEAAVSAGDELRYSVQYASPFLKDTGKVEVTDFIPEGSRFISADGSYVLYDKLGEIIPHEDISESDRLRVYKVVWNHEGVVPKFVGEHELVIEVTQAAIENVVNGFLENKASIHWESENTEEPEKTPEPEEPTTKNPVTSKYVDADSEHGTAGASVTAGNEITYTFRLVSPYGPDDTGTATITEKITKGMEVVEAVGWTDNGDGTYTFEVSDIAHGEVDETAKITLKVTQRAIDQAVDGRIRNNAAIHWIKNNIPDDDDKDDDIHTENPVTAKIIKDGPGQGGSVVKANDRVAYTIQFVSPYKEDSAKATVTDYLPEYARFIEDGSTPGWTQDPSDERAYTISLEGIKKGEMKSVVIVLELPSEAINAAVDGKIKNTSDIKWETENTGDDKEENPDPETPEIEVPVATSKYVDRFSAGANNSPVKETDQIDYVIQYVNESDKTATATIVERIPDGMKIISFDDDGVEAPDGKTITWTRSGVESGKGGEVRVTLEVTRDAINNAKGGKIVNDADVTWKDEQDVETQPPQKPKTENPVSGKFIAEGFGANETVLSPGNHVTYTIQLVNPYDVPAIATVAETIPTDMNFISASEIKNIDPVRGGPNNDEITWSSIPVGVGEMLILTVDMEVTKEAVLHSENGKIINRVKTSWTPTEVGIPQVPDEEIKTENPVDTIKFVQAGSRGEDGSVLRNDDFVTYRIQYVSPFTKDQGTVTITDFAPAGTEIDRYLGEDDDVPGLTAVQDGNQVIWTIEDIDPKDSGYVWIILRITDITQAEKGKIINRAHVEWKSDEDPGNNPEEPPEPDTPDVENPVLSAKYIEKGSPGEDGQPVLFGEVIEYKIQYVNPESTEQTAEIIEYLPPGIEVVETDGNYDSANDRITWHKVVPGDGHGTVYAKLRVNQAAIDLAERGYLLNRADVKWPDSEDEPDLVTETPINAKFVGDDSDNGTDRGPVTVGSIVNYTIQYASPFKESQGTVTITDRVPQGAVLVDYSDKDLAAEADGEIIWTIRDVDPGDIGEVKVKVELTDDSLKTAVNGKIRNEASLEWKSDNDAEPNPDPQKPGTENPTTDKFIAEDSEAGGDGTRVKAGDNIRYKIQYVSPFKTDQGRAIITEKLPKGILMSDVLDYTDKGAPHVVEDTQEGTITWTIEPLEPGEVGEVEIELNVTTDAIEAVQRGVLRNESEVGFESIDGDEEPPKTIEPSEETPVETAKYIAAGSPGANGAVLHVDDRVEYETMLVSPYDTDTARAVVTERIPEGMEVISAEGWNDSQDGTYTRIEENIKAGQMRKVSIVLRMTDPAVEASVEGKVRNNVDVKWEVTQAENPNNPEPDKDEEPWTENPVLSAKYVDEDSAGAKQSGIELGDPVDYIIQVISPYDKDSATATVTEKIPKGMKVISYTYEGEDDIVTYDDNARTITWTLKMKARDADYLHVVLEVTQDAIDASEYGKIINRSEIKWNSDNEDDPEPGPEGPETPTTENPVTSKYVAEGSPGAEGRVIRAGDRVVYEIQALNPYAEATAKAKITERIPAGMKFADNQVDDGWALQNDGTYVYVTGTIQPEKFETVSIVLIAEDDLTAYAEDGKIRNEVDVEWEFDDNSGGETPHEPQKPGVENPVETLKSIEKNSAGAGGGPVEVDDIIEYIIQYSSPYDSDTATATIVDHIPKGMEIIYDDGGELTDINGVRTLTWMREVGPRQSDEIMIKLRVTQKAIEAAEEGWLVNRAEVDWKSLDQTEPDPEKPEEPEIRNPVTSKYVDKESPGGEGKVLRAGDRVVYQIQVVSPFKEATAKARIIETIPNGMRFADDQLVNGWQLQSDGTYVYEIDTMNAEVSETVPIVLIAEADLTSHAVNGKIRNQAEVEWEIITDPAGEGPHEPQNPAVENPVESLKYIDTESDGANGQTVKIGDVIEYVILYSSPFDIDTATVKITDRLPTHMEIINDGGGTLLNGVLTWERTVVPKGSGEIRIKLKVTQKTIEEVKDGWIVNQAEIDWKSTNTVDPEPGPKTPETPEVKTPVTSKFIKEGAGAGGTTVRSGDTLTYTIQVVSPFKESRAKPLIKERLAPGMTIDLEANPGWSLNEENSVYEFIPDDYMEPGEIIEVQFILTVTPEAISRAVNGKIRNEAEIDWPDIDGSEENPGTVTPATENPIPGSPGPGPGPGPGPEPDKPVGIVKSIKSGDGRNGELIHAGDRLKYTIEYENSGAVDLYLTITDTLADQLQYVSHTDSSNHNGESKVIGRVIVWELFVPAGQKGSVTVTALVVAGAEGTVKNKADIKWRDENDKEVGEDESDTIENEIVEEPKDPDGPKKPDDPKPPTDPKKPDDPKLPSGKGPKVRDPRWPFWNSPRTGDDFRWRLPMMLLLLSGGAAIYLYRRRKKSKKQ